MKIDTNVVFAAEGLPAKHLRKIYLELIQSFSTVRIAERVMDLAFMNLSDFDLAICWFPRNHEKAEAFVRNVRLRSPKIPIHFYTGSEGGFELEDSENVRWFIVREGDGFKHATSQVIAEHAQAALTAASDATFGVV